MLKITPNSIGVEILGKRGLLSGQRNYKEKKGPVAPNRSRGVECILCSVTISLNKPAPYP
jgi:hypothetical protein